MDEKGQFAATLICASPKSFASGAVARQIEIQPEAAEHYASGMSDLSSDTEVRLGYLAEALATNRPELFFHQLAWLKVLCVARGVPLGYVKTNLECMRDELEERLPREVVDLASRLLVSGIERFDTAPEHLPSYLEGDAPHVGLARRFLLALLETRGADAKKLMLEAAEAGTEIRDLHRHVLGKVQAEVGRMWQMDEVTIAEEHYCTEIVSSVTTLLSARAPRLPSNGRRVIAASVSNDLHNYGVRLVAEEFESNGWEVIFLGANTPVQALIDAVRDFGGDLIAISTSLVLHVRLMAGIVDDLRMDPTTAGLPILVGGLPFNLVDDLWEVVGADGSASDATAATEVAARLTGLRVSS